MTRPAPTRASTAPDAPIPFGRLLRVEWGKGTDTRASRWLIALTALATVAIMLAPLLAKHSVDQTYDSYLQFSALGLTILLPIVSIMTLTSEWTQRTVLATFTQEPRRARVVSAKVVASGVLALLAVVFGAVVTAAALAIAAAAGRDLGADLDAPNVIGYVLFILANILMGVAIGALLHNTAASIVLFFVVPGVFAVLGAVVKGVGRWVDPSTTFNWMLEGHWSGHGAQLLVSAALWVVLPLALGIVRTMRREIK